MGGAASKFDETDWLKADGKCPPVSEFGEGYAPTIDGRLAPVSEYRMLHMVKQGIKQRNFDVVDPKTCQLLMVTRGVPGTLAYFEVASPNAAPGEEDNYDEAWLRVEVDLKRRYWTVFRYDLPSFPGQAPARRLQCDGKLHNLYRVAIITVSWSRYMAIAVRYGPTNGKSDPIFLGLAPLCANKRSKDNGDVDLPLHYMEDSSSSSAEGAPNDEATPKTSSPSKLASACRRVCTTAAHHSSPETSLHYPSEIIANADIKSNTTSTTSASLSWKSIFQRRPQASASEPSDTASANSLAEDSNSAPDIGQSSRYIFFGPFGKKYSIVSMKNDGPARQDTAIAPVEYLDEHPSQGVLDLDRSPIVKCQEIYNRIIGNHQTSLISKERVMRLLSLDQKDDSEREHLLLSDDGLSEGSSPRQPKTLDDTGDFQYDEANATDGKEGSDSPEDAIPNNSLLDDELSDENASDEVDETEPRASLDLQTSTNDLPSEYDGAPHGSGNRRGKISLHETSVASNDDDHTRLATISNDNHSTEGDAPKKGSNLIGYWIWKNSLMNHKMEMHVAKNTDLAMHVVLAVIVNQVRVERHAIAIAV